MTVHSRRHGLSCAVGVSLAIVTSGADVFAQESPAEVARRDLIAQADEARRTNNHPRALELATRAAQIRMTPSLRLFLAQENASLGRVVEALDLAGRCQREAELDASLRNRDQVVLGCREVHDTMVTRVARLVVTVPSTAPDGLVVRAQGAEVARPLWGVPFPVAPGHIVVEATAEGRAPFRQEFDLAAGARRELVVSLGAVTVSAPNPSRRVVAPAGPALERSFVQRVGAGPLVVAGIGVLALGATAGFFVARNGAVSERDAACDPSGCDANAVEINSRAETFNTLTNVSLIAGLVALAGGVTWGVVSLTRGAPARATAPLRGSVSLAENGVMIGLGGAL